MVVAQGPTMYLQSGVTHTHRASRVSGLMRAWMDIGQVGTESRDYSTSSSHPTNLASSCVTLPPTVLSVLLLYKLLYLSELPDSQP